MTNDDIHRNYRNFLSAARESIAADLVQRVKPAALAMAVQQNLLAVLLHHAGAGAPAEAMITAETRDQLLAWLGHTELPYDFLGAAHLDYLASSIKVADGKPQIEKTPLQKTSGSYYTPRKVVRRIVEETLGKKLAEAKGIREASKLRILDMACGSGVFLLEAGKKLQDYYAEQGIPQADAANIIAGQLFGADYSQEAIEIARHALELAGLSEPNLTAVDVLHNDDARWKAWMKDVFRGADADGQGFDIIIGNPPYRAMGRLDAQTKRRLANSYAVFTGHGDLHYCFFERGLQLLKPNGFLGLLTSVYFMQASHAGRLREFVVRKARIRSIIDCSGDDLFPDATIHCLITVLQKARPALNAAFRYEPVDEPAFDFPQAELSEAPWIIISDGERQWRRQMEASSVPLGEFCEIVQGPESGLNAAFVVEADYARETGLEEELLRPLVKNSDIDRYRIDYRNQLMIYTPRDVSIDDFPAIKKHLQQYRDQLENREVCRSGSAPWFAFHRPRKVQWMNLPAKIVCPYRAYGNQFAVDVRHALNDGGDVRMIIPQQRGEVNLYYLTAILNSQLLFRYFRRIGRRKGKLFEYFKDSLKMLPIRLISRTNPHRSRLIELSEQQHQHFDDARDAAIESVVEEIYKSDDRRPAPGMLF